MNNYFKTSRPHRHTVELYVSAAKVHLVSLDIDFWSLTL